MNKVERGGLADALAERVRSLSRTSDRLRALEDYREDSDAHIVGQADAEAVLRSALLALSSREGYEIAERVLAGDRVPAAEEFADKLSRAGLVIWDPDSDLLRPTALLVELMRLFESAITEAQAEL